MRNISIKKYKNLNGIKRLVYEPLNSLEPSDTFAGVKLNTTLLTWETVKDVMNKLNDFKSWETTVDIYTSCFNVSEKVFWSASIVDYFATRPFIVSTFKHLVNEEIRLLSSNEIDSMLWKSAGGDRLRVFSSITPLKQLGEIYKIYPLDLAQKPYHEILALIVMHKISNEVSKEFRRLEEKSKPKTS